MTVIAAIAAAVLRLKVPGMLVEFMAVTSPLLLVQAV
jgi:hypothetical protein